MAKQSSKQNHNGVAADRTHEELVAIKKLLILGLMRSGASQRQIASALGVNQSQVSRLFASGMDFSKKERK
jgi:predicted XRE-type DNA-binding protein